MNWSLDILRAVPEMEDQIFTLFRVLAEEQESAFFHPHPFTSEQASIIANYSGKDFYAFVLHNGSAIGYGMLRGWDEGYAIPSLGLSVHPDFRGAGLGRLLVQYLHVVASLRDCRIVRLRVRKDNYRAKRLYEMQGYRFEEDHEEYLTGYIHLKP